MSGRPLLRGQVDGITPAQAGRLFSRGDWLRPGVFRHAVLHDVMERRFATDSTQQVSPSCARRRLHRSW